ncbi:DUF1722 domain-containing protein [Morganella morganii]|uniref:DUF1722 domain-containing protein n=1 Tax=Morganella morganii TaxID=582 RepID=UPI00301E53F5
MIFVHSINAHSQPFYNELSRFIASCKELVSMNELFNEYRNRLMVLLSNQIIRRSHTNVLMHIQTYFTRYITLGQHNYISKLILDYRRVIQPILAPLTLLMSLLYGIS